MKKIILLLAASVFCFQIAGFSQARVGLAGGDHGKNLALASGQEEVLGRLTLAWKPSGSLVPVKRTRSMS